MSIDHQWIDQVRARYFYDHDAGTIVNQKNGKRLTGHLIAGRQNLRFFCLGEQVRAPDLAWILFYGELPAKKLQLLGDDPSDLRLCNIQETDVIRPKKSRTGKPVKGVSMSAGKYRAAIHLGTFDTVEEAESAYQDALRKLGKR